MARDRGLNNDEELFLNNPHNNNDDGDSPTIEPLRIFKPHSPSPSPKPADNRSQFRYPAPPQSSSSSSTPANKQPAFPLPPGALSSANSLPLPYPDDDDSSKRKPARPVIKPSYNDTSPRLTSPSDGKVPGLAARRGTAPKPLSPDSDEREELFIKPIGTDQRQGGGGGGAASQKPFYPPPPSGGNEDDYDDGHHRLVPGESAVNRFASTASTSTTRASRGSPPPPETPIVGPGGGIPGGGIPGVPGGGGIEARFAASGISGTETLTSLQAQSAAAAQRLAAYGGQAPNPRRPWTPTESPDQQPHGPPTVYQGSAPVSTTPPPGAKNNQPGGAKKAAGFDADNKPVQVSVLEQDFQRLGAKTPPPAYSSVNPGGASSSSSSGYPNEKGRPSAAAAQQRPSSNSANSTPTPAAEGSQPPPSKKEQAAAAAAAAAAASSTQSMHLHGHPAFANESILQNGGPSLAAANIAASGTGTLMGGTGTLSSPPPLPEGWISHLDQNSGQYYYIHLATQATQWEFPKGPNPFHHEQAPLSPTASTYGNPMASPMFGGKQGMTSPMFPPNTPGYAESIMSVATSATPSAAGFSGPPPNAGVDTYKIQPTNGVYFGPYLRYVNMNVEKGIWHGSILIVTDSPQAPTIHMHLSVDLSPNPPQVEAHAVYTHQRWTFYKYNVELPMGEGGTERWTYAVTSHLGCTRYEFVVAGRHETGWRFIAHSGNDFAASTSQNERSRLGGVSFMWKDVLQKNVEVGGFHAQLGLGDQLYGDRLWKEVPLLKQWLAMSGKDNRKNSAWTARHEEDVSHAYFHYYTSHFDQPFLREAFAQIPHILQIDDHDIFDGYGSYPDYMQNSNMFKNIGRIAIEMYLLFQHHTTVEILRNVSNDLDLFTITGQGWHFVKFLGPAVVVVGPDCRSERNRSHVMAGPTYQGIFPKVATLPPSVQHCIWMLSVPIIYPRLEAVESLAGALQTGKKAVNTTYNIFGKVTSSVAGVVGGKEVVQQGFSHVKKAMGKSGVMGNVLNQFGDIDFAEELKDMWTHASKDLERTYLIRTLQSISQQKGVRMTFFSGDVRACGAGLVHDPTHPSDHKTMYQIVASPMVAAPQGSYLLKMLHNNKSLYVAQNGQKSSHEVSDTKEDMMEIFHADPSGAARELKKLMGRRNYVAVMAYDPEALPAAAGGMLGMQQMPPPTPQPGQEGLSKLSLAIDFIVQGDAAFQATTKYGPVIVPHLEYGR